MLKGKLKKALKKAGLNEELAQNINITSEDQIEGIIISLQSTQSNDSQLDFSQVLGSQEFADFIEKNGFDGVLKLSKSLQSEHDKKVTAGIKTFKDKYFKQIDGDDNDDDEDGAQNNDNKMPAWAKALMEKVDGIEKSKTTESKLEQAKAAITKSEALPDKLKEKWLSRIDLESETSFEDQVKSLESEHQEIHTAIVGDNSGRGLPVGGQSKNDEANKEDVDAIVANLI
ncbi:hypothetical protein [Changchengzhania lutea]|uniref:hypothetical protein n=1 Tax=Changchengzhania lutea TaxID=2049305 RepID=UPI00115E5E1D|nr:hypothetical protein [Changchengzhania lutea]